ncbi:carbohydrate kinase family protein [Streptomyces sp. O3]
MTTLVIGEVLVDLIWHASAGSVTPAPGGSPANVAVGLHRLEHPARLATCWGDDVPGALVSEYVHGTGLPVDRAESASGRTTVALAYVDADGGATYDFLTAWDPVRLPVPPTTALLHTGSLAIVAEPGAERVREACHEARTRYGATVSLDLNVRPAVQPDRAAYLRAVERITPTADVVKASDEDLAWLFPALSPDDAARRLLALGPRLVVTTYGADGARGLLAGAEGDGVTVPAPPVKVVDTIGAGDAFQAALLAGLLPPAGDGDTDRVTLPDSRAALEPILRQAVTAGALTCERPGAQPPTRAELTAALP